MPGKNNDVKLNSFSDILNRIPHAAVLINRKKEIICFNEKSRKSAGKLFPMELIQGKSIYDYMDINSELASGIKECEETGLSVINKTAESKEEFGIHREVVLFQMRNKNSSESNMVIIWLEHEGGSRNVRPNSDNNSEKLVSIIAHDLINPITGIMGFSELMIKEIGWNNMKKKGYEKKQGQIKIPAENPEFGHEDLIKIDSIIRQAGIINNSIKAVFSLLDNLLDWSRTQRNEITPSVETICVSELIAEVADFCKIPSDIKNIEIRNVINSKISVTADRNMLKSILRNLISNAVKFTPRDGSIEITAAYTSKHPVNAEGKKNNISGKYVRINVSDNGIGIPENRLKTLLTGKERFSTKGTGGEKGTGLGLLVSREFVEKMGGYITIKSKRGVGSIFSVSLPAD
ncbi:MAG: HAMP domain-containing sensor histidine kinase [Ignavibacteria bacterium]|nr:HAMP domain-containing sensor histidine kinase [Ignavibacteria bacterium]